MPGPKRQRDWKKERESKTVLERSAENLDIQRRNRPLTPSGRPWRLTDDARDYMGGPPLTDYEKKQQPTIVNDMVRQEWAPKGTGRLSSFMDGAYIGVTPNMARDVQGAWKTVHNSPVGMAASILKDSAPRMVPDDTPAGRLLKRRRGQ